MLSHTLVETITETIRYLQIYPEIYQPHEQEIRTLVSHMESLQRKLDTPEANIYKTVRMVCQPYEEAGDRFFRCTAIEYPEIVGTGETPYAAEVGFKVKLAEQITHLVLQAVPDDDEEDED